MTDRDIRTVRIGNKLIVTNGADPLTYIDLTKVQKGSKRKAIIRYSDRYKGVTGLLKRLQNGS